MTQIDGPGLVRQPQSVVAERAQAQSGTAGQHALAQGSRRRLPRLLGPLCFLSGEARLGLRRLGLGVGVLLSHGRQPVVAAGDVVARLRDDVTALPDAAAGQAQRGPGGAKHLLLLGVDDDDVGDLYHVVKVNLGLGEIGSSLLAFLFSFL